MTEYDVQRMAMAVVNLLLDDERFIRRMERLTPKRKGVMLNSRQAAQRIGISQYTLRKVAPFIGGIKKGDGKQDKWAFEEEGLKERYLEYINSK